MGSRSINRPLLVAALVWLAPALSAAAGPALLYDAATRQVLYAEDADQPWYPASLTKLMTAYLVFEAWKDGRAEPAGKITISARANSRPKMRLGLGAGKVITFEEAMAALILHSANDIAVALAEALAGSEAEFVERMNATAARLGMASTRFSNPHGLPGEGQHSTARDLAILTQALMIEFPQHSGLFAQMTAPVGKRTVSTHNPALTRIAGGDGMKTGFTCSAGYNIVASVTRDSIRLVAIVLGENTQALRVARTAALIEHGFRTLDWKAVFPPTTLDNLPVEPFDAEQARIANLVKRLKDCQAPEPQLNENGNPICPPVKEIRSARSARAIKAVKAMRTIKGAKAKPDVCAPQVAAKPAPPQQRMAAKLPVPVQQRVLGKTPVPAQQRVVAKSPVPSQQQVVAKSPVPPRQRVAAKSPASPQQPVAAKSAVPLQQRVLKPVVKRPHAGAATRTTSRGVGGSTTFGNAVP